MTIHVSSLLPAQARLDGRIREIMLQFNVTKKDSVNGKFTWVDVAKQESQTNDYEEKHFMSSPRVNVLTFARDLLTHGFVMTEAHGRIMRSGEPDIPPKRRARFIFARNPKPVGSEHVAYIRSVGLPVFVHFCESAAWTVDGFRNEIADGEGFCINCSAPVRFVLPNGERYVERKRDACGKQYGEPVPFEPSSQLRIEQNAVVVI